jgi:hypothetical protein
MPRPVFIPAARRRFGKGRPRQALPPAPPVVNQITSVVYGASPDTLVVTVSGTLVSVADLSQAMRLEIDENMYDPIDANLDELPQVVLTYERDVTTATAWTVISPAAWEFAEGDLAAPFGGSIE